MKAILVSKSKAAELLFSSSDFGRMAPPDLDAALADPPADAILYLDASSFTRKALGEILDRLAAVKRPRWAVVDRSRVLDDPAALFHSGALDYVGPDAPEGFVDDGRLGSVDAFAQRAEAEQGRQRLHRPKAGSFPGWDALSEGQSYDLLIMYASLCDADGLRTRLGDMRFTRLKGNALALVGAMAQELDGRLWIADDRSFLCLFQPDSLPAAFNACLGLLANARLCSFEHFKLEQEVARLSFSFHRAPVPWQKPGQTGTIVSDAINFIYHLGRKFTPCGVIDLVRETAAELPERLAAHLVDAGGFEDKAILRFPGFQVSGSE